MNRDLTNLKTEFKMNLDQIDKKWILEDYSAHEKLFPRKCQFKEYLYWLIISTNYPELIDHEEIYCDGRYHLKCPKGSKLLRIVSNCNSVNNIISAKKLGLADFSKFTEYFMLILIQKGIFSQLENYMIKPNINLMLEGTTGSGKTTCAKALVYEFYKKGKTWYFIEAIPLQKLFQRSEYSHFRDEQLESYQILQEIIKCDFLVIDDIGTQKRESEFFAQELFSLLNHRENKHIIWTTNSLVDGNAFQHLDARIESRVNLNLRTINFPEIDFRIENKEVA